MEPSVAPALARIRRRRATFFLMWLAYLPLFAGTSRVAQLLALDFERFVPFAFWSYASLWILSGLFWTFSRCPRCHERFFFQAPFRRTFSQCAHCGLPLADPDLRLGRFASRLIAGLLFVLAFALFAFAVMFGYGVIFGSLDGALGFVSVLLAVLAAYCTRLGANGWRASDASSKR